MSDRELNGSETRTAFEESFGRVKQLLDKIAFEVYQNSDDADIKEKVDLRPLFEKANLNYNTFLQNSGYAKLGNYGGVWNIKQQKAIKFNPEKYLRARNLGESNEYYIEEIYE